MWIPAGPAAPRAAASVSLVVGSAAQSPDAVGDALGRRDRRARRRVDLAVVVQLDDLDGVEERRGELAETHQQHRRDREVGGDDGVPALRCGRGGGEGGEVVVGQSPVVPTTAWMPWPSSTGHVVPRRGCGGEVDDHLTLGGGELGDVGRDGDTADDLGGRARIDGGDELEGVVSGDRAAGGRPHPSAGAAHADADHQCQRTSHRWCTGSWIR